MNVPPRPRDEPSRLVFGMVPQRDDEKTRLQLSGLCEYLTRQMGIPVAPHRSPSADALASALHTGRVHVAWIGALSMLLSEHMKDMVPLLCAVRAGVAFYHSVLVTPAASSIRDLAGARGKRIAWVARTSASGYVVPRLSLARAGIAASDLFSKEVFAGSHADVSRALANGEVDVAATYAVFVDGDPNKPMVKSGLSTFDSQLELRVLDVSGPIPSDLIVAAPSVGHELRRSLSSALIRVAADPGSKDTMTELIGADAFTRFTPAVLREVRALVDAAQKSGALEKAAR